MLKGVEVQAIDVLEPSDVQLTICKGMAVSPDGSVLVTVHGLEDKPATHALSVYALPEGTHVRTVARGRCTPEVAHESCCSAASASSVYRFRAAPRKVCFSATGDILVVQSTFIEAKKTKKVKKADGKSVLCVAELTVQGVLVRTIGDSIPCVGASVAAIAATDEWIALGKASGDSGDRVMLFDAATGVLTRVFGEFGPEPHQLLLCLGMRFTLDNRHIIVCNCSYSSPVQQCRVSMFSVAGEYVGLVGSPLATITDVEMFCDSGAMVVCECDPRHCLSVWSGDREALMMEWGSDHHDFDDGPLYYPQALAIANGRLYVCCWSRVVVLV